MPIIFVFLLLMSWSWSDVVILNYHRVGEESNSTTNITLENFKNHMRFIAKNGYKVISLYDLLDPSKKKELNMAEKTVAITFDDGYKSVYTNAFKILQKYNFPFTLFLYTDAIEHNYRDYLTIEQIRFMQPLANLGLHSQKHSSYARMTWEEMRQDFSASSAFLRRVFGVGKTFFAYPYGEYNAQAQRFLKQQGIKMAFALQPGAYVSMIQAFEVPRLYITNGASIERILNIKALNAKITLDKNVSQTRILSALNVQTHCDKKLKIYVNNHFVRFDQNKINSSLLKFYHAQKLLKSNYIKIRCGNAWKSQFIRFKQKQGIKMLEDIYVTTQDGMQKSLENLKREFAALRTGKVSAAIVDNIKVDYYGNPTPLNQVGSVLATDATTITISPWEKSILSDIENAIQKANIGVNPNNDGEVIKLFFPPMSGEQREAEVKRLKACGENVKVSIRNVRRDGNDKIKKLEKNKQITQDESKVAQDKVQKITDDFIQKVDTLMKDKEEDILKV